jgi:methionyl-tRNA formyltransferase
MQPERPRDPQFLDQLRALHPDCCPVVAYGALVPPAALAIPPQGWVNLHFSLLPAWRGAAPVQHALLAGDPVTGASTFQLEEGLDTGPVYGVVTTEVAPEETAGELLARLADVGAGLMVATLDGIEDGTLVAQPQPGDGVSMAPKLSVDDARIDWAAPALRVHRLVRACTPSPGAWTTLRDKRVKIGPVRLSAAAESLQPGELRASRDAVDVGTGGGAIRLDRVRPEGRGEMSASEWARGLRLSPGERFV